MYKKILIAIIIIVLGLGNVYFYNKSKKLDYAIRIGTPTEGYIVKEDGNFPSTGIDFYEPLSDRNEANILLFSLLNSVSVEKPKVCETLPNLVVYISEWKNGVTYYQVSMWIDDDTVIIKTDIDDTESKYKAISGTRASDLKNLIEKYDVTKTYK